MRWGISEFQSTKNKLAYVLGEAFSLGKPGEIMKVTESKCPFFKRRERNLRGTTNLTSVLGRSLKQIRRLTYKMKHCRFNLF